MLNELSKEIHENAVSHGWWDEPRNLLEIAALCHSEISEAVEEYRSGRPLVYHKCSAHESECAGWFMDMESHNCIEDKCCNFGNPEGIAVEMADCLIRILDWFGHEGLDVDAIVREKMEYNRTRPYKHGKRC